MRLLISDATILIDMEVGGLLVSMFRLHYRFAVPDTLFAEELVQHHPELPTRGLEVLPLAAPGIADAVSLLNRHRRTGVSCNDIFALALARQEACPLLTGDKNLRGVAAAEDIEVHGTPWLVEQMMVDKVVGLLGANAAYQAMRERGPRLPWAEVERQLSSFAEKHDRRRELDEVSVRARFPNVKEILATNLQTNRGLDALVRCIRHHLETLPHIGDALPTTWKRVREALESDTRGHIAVTEFLALCGRHGFTEDTHNLELSAYLHDLGICLHFQDDPILKHRVILRPSWATDAFYRVLDDDHVVAAYGHFRRDDLARFWDAPEHAGMSDELLQLMMKFELCYALPNNAGFIAPQLLRAARPDYAWPPGDDLVLRWVYGFMPKGILTRLTVAGDPRLYRQGRPHGLALSMRSSTGSSRGTVCARMRRHRKCSFPMPGRRTPRSWTGSPRYCANGA